MAIIIFDKKNKGIDTSVICNWITREYKCMVSAALNDKDGDYCVEFTNCKGLPNGACIVYVLCEFILHGVYTIKIIWNRELGIW